MARRCTITLLFGVLLGCGGPEAPNTPVETAPETAVETAETEPASEAITMNGINLYLHDARPTAGLTQKPTFWVHADFFTVLDDQVWSFEQARAVVYGQNTQEEAIALEAARGRFEEDRGAMLEGSVTARVGDMLMQMSDIAYVNPKAEGEEGLAHTENPLSVQSPTLDLKASSLRLLPESRKFVLTNVVGTLRFEGNPL